MRNAEWQSAFRIQLPLGAEWFEDEWSARHEVTARWGAAQVAAWLKILSGEAGGTVGCLPDTRRLGGRVLAANAGGTVKHSTPSALLKKMVRPVRAATFNPPLGYSGATAPCRLGERLDKPRGRPDDPARRVREGVDGVAARDGFAGGGVDQ